MALEDYYFTLPSDLGRRRSMVDPLGFRGTISHFMLRMCPGFTGRVRGRTWFPILAWAAKEIEERQVRDAQYGDDWEQARLRVGKRREAMLFLERALRLGAALQENGIKDHPRWRYGNRPRWWLREREGKTRYFELASPPFFSSRAGEVANSALGSLRRSLERLAFFAPSESRLSGGTLEVSSANRYKVTSRGQALAEAYELDLKAQGLAPGLLHDWGLWPTGRDVRNEQLRTQTLVELVPALPVTKKGDFDSARFPRTTRKLDALLQVPRDL